MSQAMRTDNEVKQLQKRRNKRHNLKFFKFQIGRHNTVKVNIVNVPNKVNISAYNITAEMGENWITPNITDLQKIINQLSNEETVGQFFCCNNTFYIG